MHKITILILLSLLVASTAGAREPQRRTLHHKSAAGAMSPVYLASDSDMNAQRGQNSSILQSFAVVPLAELAQAVDVHEDIAVIAAGDNLLQLDDQLTVVQTITLDAKVHSLALGNYDMLHGLDVAALQRTANQLTVLHSAISDTWTLPITWTIPAHAEALVSSDLNADCRTDVAFNTPATTQLVVQTLSGTLTPSLQLPFANAGFSDLAAGDLDRDGYPDLAALRGTGNVTQSLDLFLLREGELSATQGRTVDDGGFAAHAVAIGDVTNDGRADLVVGAGGNTPEALINIFVQRSNGSLATEPLTLTAWHLPESIAIADINHDGYNDVLALHSGWLALSVYLGQADGSLADYETYELPYSTSYRPDTVAVGDLDADGGLDVIIADGERGATYLLNQTGAPRSAITVGPAACSLIEGADFTLSGVLTDATALEVSLDGGVSWEAASIQGSTWTYTTTLTNHAVYPVVHVRALDGDRVQAPVTERRFVFRHQQIFLPLLTK